MTRLLRLLFKSALIVGALWALGRTLSRQFEGETTADDPEFRVLAMFGAREIRSLAQGLRSARIAVLAGGVDLDLSRATLDETGAHVSLDVSGGGVRLVVDPGWRVYVADRVVMGGVELQVPEADSLPVDAPSLTIEAIVRGGGVLIETPAAARD